MTMGKKKNPRLMNDLFLLLYPLFTDNMIPDFKFAILHVNFIELLIVLIHFNKVFKKLICKRKITGLIWQHSKNEMVLPNIT